MKFSIKLAFVFLISILSAGKVFSQDNSLKLSPENIVITARTDGSGFDLYVKKTPDVNSILLTESIKDYAGNNDNYAYRATEYNPVNGDEIRYLNGQILNSEWAKFSLVDSTPEKTPYFTEEAFHIYIPNKLVFGYTWSRYGQVEVGNRTFINIRTFEKLYADHSGKFADNPFYMNLLVVEKPKQEEPIYETLVKKEETEPEYDTSIYNQVANQKLAEISEEMIYSKGPSSLVSDIMKILNKLRGNADVVFVIDGTGSMDDDLTALKQSLIPSIRLVVGGENTNYGLVVYRDYDTYVSAPYKDLPTHIFNMGKNLDTFQADLVSIAAYGGGDTPEAVYEAIFTAIDGFNWREGTTKRIILIGDAEPHPEPRGSGLYSKEYVMNLAAEKGIKVTTILLP